MKQFKILDCTLRDGGYYTDWQFKPELVKKLVKALDSNNTDIIEMGYKSPVKGGPYRKCNDGFINSIIDFKITSKLCFMIDVKDYIKGNEINFDLLDDIINNKAASPFSVCRIAAKYEEIKYLPELCKYIDRKGYSVICNLMGVSLLTPTEIGEFVELTYDGPSIALYVADSYGSLYPNDVVKIFKGGGINGIHTHDNLGLAFANCLSSLDNGAEYVDGTLLGMGRGVGNVRTEQLLTYRQSITSELLDCIDDFTKLKEKYRWGHNTLYMMAGKNHTHPLYVQDLNQSNLSNADLLKAMHNLSSVASYFPEQLPKLKEQRAVVVIPARYKSSRFPGKPLAKINGKEMILHVAEKAELAVGKENVYIATENEKIALVCKTAGYNIVITSDNCLTGTDRVAEASKEIDADIFINVQGDEPMVDPNDIIRVIETKKNNPKSVINCMSKLHKDEVATDKKIPKVIFDLNDNLIYSSRNPIPGKKEGDSTIAYKQVAIYAFSMAQLNNFSQDKKTPLENEEDIEINRFIEKGIPVKMLRVTKVSYAVDYLEDIKIVERELK